MGMATEGFVKQPGSIADYRRILKEVKHLDVIQWLSGEKPCVGFMTHLPDGDGTELKVPVPYVTLPLNKEGSIRKGLAEMGITLQPCLLFLVKGYHHAEDRIVRCLVRNPDAWWDSEPGREYKDSWCGINGG